MIRKSPLLALALALALALTGCIQNMGALKERIGGDEGDPLEPTSLDNETPAQLPAQNETPKLPPVARISIFAANGALVYKSTFQAEDPSEIVFVEEKTALTVIAGDSETLEPEATLAGFAWTLDGKAVEGGRQARVEIGEAGLYTITLVVTDSNGEKDAHTVKLGVAPKPFDVETRLLTGPVLGAEGVGQSGEVSFDLALDESKGPAMVQAVVFRATPAVTCDAILDVTGPDGESVGHVDGEGNGGVEEIAAGALPLGTYAIVVSPFACAEPEGVPVTVIVTYLPMVPGLAAGDGHGHAH